VDFEENFEEDYNWDFEFEDPEWGDGTPTEENEEATRHISNARDHLAAAYRSYVGQAGEGANLLQVTPVTEDFTATKLRTDIKNAVEELEAATETATRGQAKVVLALREVALFMFTAAKVDEYLGDAYEEFDFAMQRLYNENLPRADTARRRMNEHIAEGQPLFRDIDREIETQAFEHFPQVRPRVASSKQQRLQRQIRIFDRFDTGIQKLAEAIDDLQAGADAYLGKEWEDARDDLQKASSSFSFAVSSFNERTGATGMSEELTEVYTAVRTMQNATTNLKRSAEGQLASGDNVDFYEGRRAARRHIRSNEHVKQMPTFRRLAY
jgi:hypothetical protein